MDVALSSVVVNPGTLAFYRWYLSMEELRLRWSPDQYAPIFRSRSSCDGCVILLPRLCLFGSATEEMMVRIYTAGRAVFI